jgi:hypothetical protein
MISLHTKYNLPENIVELENLELFERSDLALTFEHTGTVLLREHIVAK